MTTTPAEMDTEEKKEEDDVTDADSHWRFALTFGH